MTAQATSAARPTGTSTTPPAGSVPDRFRPTVAGGPGRPVSTYSALLAQVKGAGLLDRRTGFYGLVFGAVTLGLVVTGTAFVLLGDSWWQLVVAAALGVVLTQYAFLTHEVAHRQVFATGPVGDRVGRVLAAGVVGVSYAWWTTKHTRHHAAPNTVGKDPDIDIAALAFTPDQAAAKRGALRWLARRQGWAFFPLLLLEGLSLHVTSFRTLLARRRVEARWLELALVTAHFALYLGVLTWFLSPGVAAAFVGVQLAVFGLYMGASFAPNHKGMPVLPEGSRVDFLSRQVLTSRNVRGGRWVTTAMGGLDHQIEHHLFPSMPRPHLARARLLVKAHCAEHGVPYTEKGLVESYRIVIRYLNDVGLGARDPFTCPVATDLRPR